MPSFDKSLFVAHEVADLDDVAGSGVFEDFERLRRWYAAGEQFYQVSCVEDGGWVVGFEGCAYGHTAFNQVERAGYAMGGEGAGYQRPGRAEIVLAVFGEEGCKGRFFCEAGGIVGCREWVDLKV